MDTIKIKTTQNVEVEYAIASVGDRILAYLVDSAIYVGWIIIFAITNIYLKLDGPWIILMFVPIMFYHLFCEIFMNGQSLGKRALDLKVVKLAGHAPTVSDYLLRWVFRLLDISMLSGLVAIITIVVSGKGQRVGDIAAGTSVIKTTPVQRRNAFQVPLEENYTIVFPEVAVMSDKDMALLRKLLFKAIKYQNETLLQRIADRAKEVMDVTTQLDNRDFLKTIIKDYQHLTAGAEV